MRPGEVAGCATFGFGRRRHYRITASSGVAAAADLESEVLLEAADRARYRTKKNGKNQVQDETFSGSGHRR